MVSPKDSRYSNSEGNTPLSNNLPVANDSANNPPNDAGTRAVDRFQIFETVALERLQAGNDSTKPASFLPLPVKFAAIAAASIAGLGVLWSVLARVPIQVNGTGAIVMRGAISSLMANGNGVLQYQVSGVAPNRLSPQQRSNNTLLSSYWIEETLNPNDSVTSIQTLKELTKAAMATTQGQNLTLPEEIDLNMQSAGKMRTNLVHYPGGTLLAIVKDPLAHQELDAVFQSAVPTETLHRGQQIDRERRSNELAQLGRLMNSQQIALKRELNERKALYQRYESLWKQGYIPGTTMLEERSRINSLEAQLLNGSSTKLNTGMNQKDQLDQARQSTISNAETRLKLENQLSNFMSRTRIFAPQPEVYILAYYFRNGALVKQGDEILIYSLTPPELPNLMPVFLDAVAAQQVSEGMNVLLTPKGISRAEYGGIRGKVEQVSKLPIAADNLIGALGSRGMASQIQQIYPAPYLAWIRLERVTKNSCKQVMSRRCYRWASGKVPPQPVRLNTLADVQITTAYQRPIEFVMPALKKFLGLVVDNQ